MTTDPTTLHRFVAESDYATCGLCRRERSSSVHAVVEPVTPTPAEPAPPLVLPVEGFDGHVPVFTDVECPQCDGGRCDCLGKQVKICAQCDEDWPCERVQAYERGKAEVVAHIRAIHFQYRTAWTDEFDTCAGCNQGMELVPWPCPTIRALDALKPGGSDAA